MIFQTTYNRDVMELNGWKRYHCAPIAIARALATDPTDTAQVAELARGVVRDMKLGKTPGRWKAGTYYGGFEKLAAHYGFGDVRKVEADYSRVTRRRCTRTQKFPTVAQWFRDNPDVEEALLRTTGHAAYWKRGHAFSVSSRMRVDTAIVLDPSRHDAQPEIPNIAPAAPVELERAAASLTGPDGQLSLVDGDGQLSLF